MDEICIKSMVEKAVRMVTADVHVITMDFAIPLSAARKQRGLIQQALAEHVGVRVTQLRRYEAGTSAPTLDVLRKVAIALHVSTDSLVFADHEREPGDDLKLAFEVATCLDPPSKTWSSSSSKPSYLMHEAKRWASYEGRRAR